MTVCPGGVFAQYIVRTEHVEEPVQTLERHQQVLPLSKSEIAAWFCLNQASVM